VPAVPRDELFEKYLQKAITEINDLGHEIAAAGGGPRAAVLGSGHPMADIMLVKYDPKPSEIQEGVAFFGRSGQAILKSLQRLRVDPMSIYGTNCLKLVDEDEAEARPFLVREIHIVQPRMLVVMGADALRFVNELGFPLSEKLEPRLAEIQRFTSTIEALYCPDIDDSLDEQQAKTAFWKSFKLIGSWWAEQPPY
jgi:uracil-DNA glycosylase family 4